MAFVLFRKGKIAMPLAREKIRRRDPRCFLTVQ
jgi:hypothetical protein